jgi:hypothetical protein
VVRASIEELTVILGIDLGEEADLELPMKLRAIAAEVLV